MTSSKPDASPKSPAESLIEKLEACVSHAVNPSMQTLGRNQAIIEAISIVRRHYEGHPAVEGKPLELQSRDELLNLLRTIRLCENHKAGDEIKSVDAEVIASKIGRQHLAEQPQDVVERVAKAICRAGHDSDEDFQSAWDEHAVGYTIEAGAVIAAMGDGSATIEPVSAETVPPIPPAGNEQVKPSWGPPCYGFYCGCEGCKSAFRMSHEPDLDQSDLFRRKVVEYIAAGPDGDTPEKVWVGVVQAMAKDQLRAMGGVSTRKDEEAAHHQEGLTTSPANYAEVQNTPDVVRPASAPNSCEISVVDKERLVNDMAKAYALLEYPKRPCSNCGGDGREPDDTPCGNPNERGVCIDCKGKGYWQAEPTFSDRFRAAFGVVEACLGTPAPVSVGQIANEIYAESHYEHGELVAILKYGFDAAGVKYE